MAASSRLSYYDGILGNAPDTLKEDALGRVGSELANEVSFGLELGDIGGFGKSDSPRILWAGVKQQERLLPFKESL